MIMEKGIDRRYTSVIQVRWELPFPLMLREEAFLCWEPGEGVGVFNPSGHIGTLQWKRSCTFLTAKDVFGVTPRTQASESLPTHSYRQDCVLTDGKHVTTADHGGQDGFRGTFTVANIFLAYPNLTYKDVTVPVA
jgi:hypothetical protein